METTTELILHGHFSNLRDAINKRSLADQKLMNAISILKETFNYLSKLDQDDDLDEEGQDLHLEMAKFLDENNAINTPGKISTPPEKKPMKKAKGKRSSENQSSRRTGS